MRLPMNGGEVDYAELNKMVDTFIENGFADCINGLPRKILKYATPEIIYKFVGAINLPQYGSD